MDKEKSRRKLANVQLTKKFHMRYFGLWVLMCAWLVGIINILLFIIVQQNAAAVNEAGMSGAFMVAVLLTSALFILGVFAMAKFSAHRIAGPFVRLQRTFDEVRDGKFDTRLKFRESDKLEEMENSFNGMLDALRQQAPPETKAD